MIVQDPNINAMQQFCYKGFVSSETKELAEANKVSAKCQFKLVNYSIVSSSTVESKSIKITLS